MVYIYDSTPLTMNKVDNLLKNLFKNLKHEEQLEIKRLAPHQPRDINIFQKDIRKLRTFSSTWFDKNSWLTAAIKKRAYFAFAFPYLEVRVYGQIKFATAYNICQNEFLSTNAVRLI